MSAVERRCAPGMYMTHLTHIWLAAKHRSTLTGQRTDGREEGAAPSAVDYDYISPGSAGALQLVHTFPYLCFDDIPSHNGNTNLCSSFVTFI